MFGFITKVRGSLSSAIYMLVFLIAAILGLPSISRRG
jgi:hypothetical protein